MQATDRLSTALATRTGDNRKAMSYRLITESGEPITSGKRGQSQSGGATRYRSRQAAAKAAYAYSERTGKPALIDIA